MSRLSLAATAATIASLLMIAPATAADGALASPAKAPVETVGPSAKGDPKPFRTFVQAECDAATCVTDFGKKNKVRTVDWVSCGLNSVNGEQVISQITLTDPAVPVGFPAVVSRADLGNSEIAISEFAFPFDVPAGEKLLISMSSSGTAAAGQCVVSGTMK